MPKNRSTPGEQLRAIRYALRLTLHDVHNASLKLARKLRHQRFILPASRPHDIEVKDVIPRHSQAVHAGACLRLRCHRAVAHVRRSAIVRARPQTELLAGGRFWLPSPSKVPQQERPRLLFLHATGYPSKRFPQAPARFVLRSFTAAAGSAVRTHSICANSFSASGLALRSEVRRHRTQNHS